MKIIIPRKVDKYLKKQRSGDLSGVSRVMQFLDSHLSIAENPTMLPNCKKCKELKTAGVGALGTTA